MDKDKIKIRKRDVREGRKEKESFLIETKTIEVWRVVSLRQEKEAEEEINFFRSCTCTLLVA